MRTEKYLNLLKEELSQYGNITIQSLLKKIDKEEKDILNIENVKLKWTQYYGEGAYELVGEKYEGAGTLKQLLEQIFHSKVYLLSLSDLDSEYIEDEIIYDNLANELFDSIFVNEHMGNSWKSEYELKFIGEKPNKDIFKRYLSRLKSEEGWEYEELDKYFNF